MGDALVLGLGKSGRAVARRLAELMRSGDVRSVTVADAGDSEALRTSATELGELGARVLLGVQELPDHYALCVASPGIPPHSQLMRAARSVCDHVVSEIEFAFQRSGVPWIAVTGTNGKTTTTALITHLLRAGGIVAASVGNIGFAATDALALDDVEVLVAEVSSFQLALTETFQPKVAVLLNITPDHIDWHGSLEAYTADKTRIFANLSGEDLAVIDVDDAGSAPFAESVAAQGVPVARVSRSHRYEGGATSVGGVLTLETEGGPLRLIRADELQIRGAHNVSNALAAAAAANALGVDAVDLREGLRTFEPIEHRLEPVRTVGGVDWYNDSKATNPDAVYQALRAFEGRRLIVLLGGRNKGNDFIPLAEQVARSATAAVLFGESRIELAGAFDGVDMHTVEAVTLHDAVEVAASLAEPGDVVVLSPACASFDEFRSYEHRGDEFKRYVTELAGEER
ncbi:MAG TPA: UDP-N-acetylmuramoyl-L-alanine--D-glutamate ligase [Coriobacteriia bacterium]